MLMWKSPPRTVLLLKKLGDELMEEAKEVHTNFSLRACILLNTNHADTYIGVLVLS